MKGRPKIFDPQDATVGPRKIYMDIYIYIERRENGNARLDDAQERSKPAAEKNLYLLALHFANASFDKTKGSREKVSRRLFGKQ